MELIDVVMKLVGPVDPVGETHTDIKRLDNLIVLRDLTRELLDRIESVAETSGGHMASVKVAKDCAASFLADVRGVDAPALSLAERIYAVLSSASIVEAPRGLTDDQQRAWYAERDAVLKDAAGMAVPVKEKQR